MARLWKNILPAGALGLAFTMTSSTAVAFFPPVPAPGETVTVVPPVPPDPIVVPPVPVVPPVCKPPEKPVSHPCGCNGDPGTPQTVPEPGTLLLAGSGLALAAGWLKKRK
ncbi:hypothetical protein BH11PLA2_BH11PLA2_23820 [soil metagenome]